MNSIRLADGLPHVWLEVNIQSEDEYGFTVTSTMFDGTPFSIHVPKLKLEVNTSDSTKGLLEVSRIGNGFGYVEITLPTPVLRFGHQVRVLSNQIVNPTPKITTGMKYRK